jgi:transposase InsO family protein
MNVHKNARLTPHSRAELVRRIVVEGQKASVVAAAFGICVKTACKWTRRFAEEGQAGLTDRSSRPRRIARRTPPEVALQIEAFRRQRLTGKTIAAQTGVCRATVSRVLRRLKLSRIRDLETPEPVRRYERKQPGELLHIDIKTLGRFDKPGHRITGKRTLDSKSRGAGRESVHLAIDDHSRIAFAQVLPDESAASATAFLKDALAYYESLGITIQRIMTDNGGCYISDAFGKALKHRRIKHIRTKPYTPKTNGKAERFVQTTLREWAYAKPYLNSEGRAAELQPWLHQYNWHRPHGGIKDQVPISRLPLNQDNLLRLHT